MNFCFVSTLEIDSICVTFDFMAIQRGLECSKSILFVGITTFFQIGRISTIFKVSSCILYEKNPFFHTYNLQQTACRYLKKCALESLLKTGHWSDTPCISPCISLFYQSKVTKNHHRSHRRGWPSSPSIIWLLREWHG